MAPSSSVKSGPTKKKLAVRGGGAKTKKPDAPTKPAPKLPPDWPVSSAPPTTYPATASALMPGSLLQEKCSGHDIQLAKSAVSSASVEKEKGKFLLLFPGQFSFHKMLSQQLQQDAKTPSKAGAKETEETQKEEENSDFEDLTLEDDEPKDAKPTPSKKPAADLPSLGQLEGLRTDHPTFTIPFVGQSKRLVFPGRKVPTTSKFIMLSCANKQKNAVQCKSIFSSAIVFGAPKWEAVEEKETNAISTVGKEENGTGKLTHYGGSSMTMDGVARGQKKIYEGEGLAIPIVKRKGSTSIFGFPGMEGDVAPSATKQLKAIATVPKDNHEDLIDEDASSESDFSLELSRPQKTEVSSAAKSRAAPKRQASLKRNSYAAEDDDDDSEGSDEEDSDVKEVPPPTKSTKVAAPKRQASQKRKSIVTTKKQAKESVDGDVISEEEDDDIEVLPVTKRAKLVTAAQFFKKKTTLEDESSAEEAGASSKRTKTATVPGRKKKSSDHGGSSDDSSDFEDVQTQPKRLKKPKADETRSVSSRASTLKTRPGRKSAAAAQKKLNDILNSTSSEDKSEEESDEDPLPKKASKKTEAAKSGASKPLAGRSRKKEAAVKTLARTPKAPTTKTKKTLDTPVSVTQQSPEPKSPALKPSPFRRRRKSKSPGTKRSPGLSSKSAFDLTADSDDEFNFGEES